MITDSHSHRFATTSALALSLGLLAIHSAIAQTPPPSPGFGGGSTTSTVNIGDGGVRTFTATVESTASEPTDPSAAIQQQIHRSIDEIKRATSHAGRAVSTMRFGLSGSAASRLLVIPGSSERSAPISQTRSELAIMSRLLTKAANPESNTRASFRFDFGGVSFGEHRELDALYLDGYGAVFLIDVDYPLVAPPKLAATGGKDTNATDAAWEVARREVPGVHGAGDAGRSGVRTFTRSGGGAGMSGFGGFGGGSVGGGGAPAEVEYQADRVKQLTDRLIGALRHASNIKSMLPTDKLVVHVHGQSARNHPTEAVEKVIEEQLVPGGGGAVGGSGVTGVSVIQATETVDENGPNPGTSLTLEVPMSAVQDVAEARITREEFAKRVRVVANDDSREEK